jgi:hypothetical protein
VVKVTRLEKGKADAQVYRVVLPPGGGVESALKVTLDAFKVLADSKVAHPENPGQ